MELSALQQQLESVEVALVEHAHGDEAVCSSRADTEQRRLVHKVSPPHAVSP